MKFFVLSAMLLSTGLFAQALSGNGQAAPSGTSLMEPQTMGTSTYSNSESTTSQSGMINSSGVTTDQMNTSPNAAPTTEAELNDDATLSTGEVYKTGPYTREGTFGPRKPDEIQAQEENALDYSTTPSSRTTTPLGPNKK